MLRIKKERKKGSLTLKVVAAEVGVTYQHISLIENGKRKPSWKLQQRLVNLFGVAAEQLFGDAGTENI